VLRSTGDGSFQVIQDEFNPNGGYFVTAEYSEDTWRTRDRVPGHTVIRVGALSGEADGNAFEPVVHAGGRVDFEIGTQPIRGGLHLGFAILGDVDIFVNN